SPDFRQDDRKAKLASSRLHFACLHQGLRTGDIGQNCQPTEIGDNLAQEFEPLAGSIARLGRQAGDGTTRLRQTRDEAGGDRISRDCEKDRDDRRCLLCRDVGGVATVTMTSTLSLMNSAAISAKRSSRPSPQRYSMATVRFSIQPSARSRCTKAAAH